MTGELIVVTVKFRHLSLFDLSDKGLTTCVVDFVVLKLKFLQRRAGFHNFADKFCAIRRDLIVSEDKGLQALFLLVA